MEGYTFVALRRLTVHGETREAGDLVPEAADWRNQRSYINTGYISTVPRGAVDQEELEAAEAKYQQSKADAGDTPAQVEETVEETEEVEETSYDDLTIQQVKNLVESGDLDPDDALEAELNRDGEPRKGVLDYLESLEEEESEDDGEE